MILARWLEFHYGQKFTRQVRSPEYESNMDHEPLIPVDFKETHLCWAKYHLNYFEILAHDGKSRLSV